MRGLDALPDRKKRSRHQDFWTEVEDNPGKWFEYPGAAASVYAAARGRGEGWEAAVRNVDGVVHGYARYVADYEVELIDLEIPDVDEDE